MKYESADPSKTISEITIFLLLFLTMFGFAFHPIIGALFFIALIIGVAAYFQFSIFKIVTDCLGDYLDAILDYWKP
ncbi:MAG: hypothetical protein KAW45_02855 [Thermoplasmatales archaeon]|nr:hypothetical protein [Thermoplasmatales archaeon]